MATRNDLGQPVGATLDGWTPPPAPQPVTLEGRWCRLVPLDPGAHARPLFEAFAEDRDGRLWTYMAYGPFAGFEDFAGVLDGLAARPDMVFFTILDAASGAPRGLAAYLRIDPRMGSVEVGSITYAPVLQQTAAATEAMALMMRHAFELGYRRYEWKCDALNEPSRRAALRLGFTFEGIFRQHFVIKGRNRDTAWYAILDHEWPRLAAAFDGWLAPENFDGAGRQKRPLAGFTGQ
ncbi:MAG: GNAT family protein [Hyphomicrobiales bacterium]